MRNILAIDPGECKSGTLRFDGRRVLSVPPSGMGFARLFEETAALPMTRATRLPTLQGDPNHG
jgi:hypothetical protein